MIKSRLTLTLLGACAVLAAAWPFRYQLYLHLPSEPVHRLVVKDGLYWLKGKVYSGRITETDVLKGGGLITITPVIDGVREGKVRHVRRRRARGHGRMGRRQARGPRRQDLPPDGTRSRGSLLQGRAP